MGKYFRGLYRRTMAHSYEMAYAEIARCLDAKALVLDCGTGNGRTYDELLRRGVLSAEQYHGIDRDLKRVEAGRNRGLNISRGDLNRELPYPNGHFGCVFALSVLEHLLFPCRFLAECRRVLKKGGRLVLLTPNISTYFSVFLLLLGKMPSSGPHPDSEALLKNEELFKVSSECLESDAENDTPVHRHLVVFSYRVLRDYLKMVGFENIAGFGFGLYPFPNAFQPLLERLDPYHCHQMVFAAQKRS